MSMLDSLTYDHVIISFSGGKDSMACLLHVLELGVPRERIELWHMLVDGRESEQFADWPITEAYCQAIAAHFGLPIYFAWKEGGFLREMLRKDQPTAPTHFERNDGTVGTIGGNGPLGTRGKFPQVSADLRVRWCSAYLKIDVCAKAIANQERFNNKRTLLVTGERGEESKNRAGYAVQEPHHYCHKPGKRVQRHVDHWRPIRDWPEADVWAAMQRWKVRPHPAYQLGWSRVSCATCIFGNADQWASAAQVLPGQVAHVARREADSGLTIQRTHSVPQLVAKGTPYANMDAELVAIARGKVYALPVRMDPWQMPPGAFGHSCGPG